MEFDLYVITNEGSKLDLTKPQLLPEEKWVLEVLKEQPLSIYGVLKKIRELKKEDITHYTTQKTLEALKGQGYVEIRK